MGNRLDKLFVHFDYVKNTSESILGALVFKSELEMTPVREQMATLPAEEILYYNNYHLTLKSFMLALQTIEEVLERVEVGSIKLYNQNAQVFTWLVNSTYDNSYSEMYMAIYTRLSRILDKAEIEYCVIDGKHNKVKKLLKAKKQTKAPVSQKLDLSFIREAIGEVAVAKEENKQDNVIPLRRMQV